MVDASSMDIKMCTKIFDRHRTTLDMPSGKSDSPGTISLHITLLTSHVKLP